MKKCCSLKLDRCIYRDLIYVSRQLSTEAVSIVNYKIHIFKFVFHTYPSYLCKVFFLTTLNIYKDYFKGRQRDAKLCNLMKSDYSCILWPETICLNSSYSLLKLLRFCAEGFITKKLLNLHRLDELKNFVTNIFFKLVC